MASSRCLRCIRHYSSQPTPSTTAEISALTRRKWGVGGLPTPRSILNSDDPLPPSLSLTSEPDDTELNRNPNTPPPHLRKPSLQPTPPIWKAHRKALKQAFPNGWQPQKKISREAMESLRELHKFNPDKFTTPVLADRFRISPEAVRRILKSRWVPSEEKKLKWAEREQEVKEERLMAKNLARQKERDITEDIMLAKQFSGGLSFRK